MSKLETYMKESVGVLPLKVKLFFILALLLSLLAEYVVHRHSYFEVDGLPMFHAVFGFASCAVIVAVSKILGLVVKQPDTFYDDGEES